MKSLITAVLIVGSFVVGGIIVNNVSETGLIKANKDKYNLFGGSGKVVVVYDRYSVLVENQQGNRIIVCTDDELPAVGDNFNLIYNSFTGNISLLQRQK